MAYADRHYYGSRESGSTGRVGFGIGGGKSVVWWLIAINVTVFILDRLLLGSGRAYQLGPHDMGPLEYWGHFSATTAVLGLQLWRFITFQFLHADAGHILFNMIGLFFFGPMIERYLGSRRFLAFYLLCGVSGVVVYLLLWATGILFNAGWVPLVGASAGIFGILIAAARIAPNTTVLLMLLIPMKLKILAWLMIGYGAFTVLTGGPNAGGEAAHLGGAALGFVLIRNVRWLNFADGIGGGGGPLRQWINQREQRRKERARQVQRRAQDEIDRILIKVKDHGLASLTEKEKQILRQETERQRRVG